MMGILFRWAIHASLVSALACEGAGSKAGAGSEPDAAEPDAHGGDAYALEESWLCNPEHPNNRCQTRGSATEVDPERARAVVDTPGPAIKDIDCFYVYPTVDLRTVPGRASDYANINRIWETARVQAEPFADVCNVYAPLYHQATVGTYLNPSGQDEILEEVYEEIDGAFRYYMAEHNEGRRIVLIGHSQGSHMLRRLLQRRFDGPQNAAMRQQLAVALLVGAMGDVTVPPGEVVGGSFDEIPLCERLGQKACVVTFNAYPETIPPTDSFGSVVGGVPEGMESPCTNPAALGGGAALSAGAFFQSVPAGIFAGTTPDLRSEFGVDSYFTVFRDFYGVSCKMGDAGQPFLAVSVDAAPGDKRMDPIRYMSSEILVDLVGLHILDFNLTLDDLLAVVRAQAE